MRDCCRSHKKSVLRSAQASGTILWRLRRTRVNSIHILVCTHKDSRLYAEAGRTRPYACLQIPSVWASQDRCGLADLLFLEHTPPWVMYGN
jgi:hypothetical protein